MLFHLLGSWLNLGSMPHSPPSWMIDSRSPLLIMCALDGRWYLFWTGWEKSLECLIRPWWYIACTTHFPETRSWSMSSGYPSSPLCIVLRRVFSIHFIIHKLPRTQPCHCDSSHLHCVLSCAASHWSLHTLPVPQGIRLQQRSQTQFKRKHHKRKE